MAYQGYIRLHNFIQRSRLVESLSLYPLITTFPVYTSMFVRLSVCAPIIFNKFQFLFNTRSQTTVARIADRPASGSQYTI